MSVITTTILTKANEVTVSINRGCFFFCKTGRAVFIKVKDGEKMYPS